MVSSLFQIVIGFSGVMGFLLKFIGPLTICPTIALVGLPLFNVAANFAGISIIRNRSLSKTRIFMSTQKSNFKNVKGSCMVMITFFLTIFEKDVSPVKLKVIFFMMILFVNIVKARVFTLTSAFSFICFTLSISESSWGVTFL